MTNTVHGITYTLCSVCVVEHSDKKLLELHQKLFLKFINERIESFKHRRLLAHIYEIKLNKDNIRALYNANMEVFTSALIQDKLESIVKFQNA